MGELLVSPLVHSLSLFVLSFSFSFPFLSFFVSFVCVFFCFVFLSPLVWFFLWLPEEVLALLFLLHCENGDFSILMKDILCFFCLVIVIVVCC